MLFCVIALKQEKTSNPLIIKVLEVFFVVAEAGFEPAASGL